MNYQENPEKGLHEYICTNPHVGTLVVYSDSKPYKGRVVKVHGARWVVWAIKTIRGVSTAWLEPYD